MPDSDITYMNPVNTGDFYSVFLFCMNRAQADIPHVWTEWEKK